jgi:sugar phosphate isomerase/epimerase
MRDLSKDHRFLSLNTATLRNQADFIGIVEACARRGIRAVSPWRDQVAKVGLDRAVKATRDAGIVLSGYCRGGMFTSDAAHVQEMRDDNLRAIEEAAAFGAPCLILVVGGLPQYSRPGSTPDKDIRGAQRQVQDALGWLLEHARKAKVPLALEPLHPMYAADRACVNTLRQALDICEAVDPSRSGMLGVAVDVYHVWWDSDVWSQIDRAGKDRLLAFHVCDWLVPTKDMLLDRGMMGDGVIDIPAYRKAVEAQGYDGFVEVEILSSDWWSRPLDEALDTVIARYKSVV